MDSVLAKDGLPCPECGCEDTRRVEGERHDMQCNGCNHKFVLSPDIKDDDDDRWPTIAGFMDRVDREGTLHERALWHTVHTLRETHNERSYMKDSEVRRRVVKTLDEVEEILASPGGVHTLGQMDLNSSPEHDDGQALALPFVMYEGDDE